MESRRHAHVVNIDELEWQPGSEGERFASARKRLAAAAGGAQIGCTLFEVPPGKRAFPFHSHSSNEESIYILEGAGTLRLGADQVKVRAGDYITMPAELELAHQLINSGAAPLRYLCFSTMKLPEIVRYPDSGKLGMMTAAQGAPKDWPDFRGRAFLLLKEGASLDYYDGE